MHRKHPLCRCEVCPLKDEPFVPTESYRSSLFAVVGDYPDDFDVREQRPFIAKPALHLTNALSQGKISRNQVTWMNVVACKPPDFYDKVLAKVRKANRAIAKQNKDRKAEGLEMLPLIPTPAECCSPRLEAELSKFNQIMPCGTMAAKAVIDKSATIMDLRGAPMSLNKNGKDLKILPVHHPKFVDKARRWMQPFFSDVSRAARWFLGHSLRWKPPQILYNPNAADLATFLAQPAPCWAYDVETDAKECLTANLRCLAIGTPSAVVVVSYLGIDGITKFYNDFELEQVTRVLKDFFENPNILKTGHNAGYYDKIVMREQLGINVDPCIDTMLLHRLVASELPHSLGFVGSMYTEAPSWKTDRQGRKKAYGSETDWELHEYCAYDVAITAAVLPPLFTEANVRSQEELISCDHKLQSICADMHTVGMYADQERRREYEQEC